MYEIETSEGVAQAFTFWVGDTHYAIALQHVLSIREDASQTRPVPGSAPGLLGIVDYHGRPVTVFDFAHHLATQSTRELRGQLRQALEDHERDHIAWLKSLERSIKEGTPFIHAMEASLCEFGKFIDSYETRNTDLKELLERFCEPHRKLHGAAKNLLELRERGFKERALEGLESARKSTLRELMYLFDQAKEIINIDHSVLLIVTEDGSVPMVSFRLDEIEDVIEFETDKVLDVARVGIPLTHEQRRIISGVIPRKGGDYSLLVDPTPLASLQEVQGATQVPVRSTEPSMTLG